MNAPAPHRRAWLIPLLIGLVVIVAIALALRWPPIQRKAVSLVMKTQSEPSTGDRVSAARERCGAQIEARCAEAGLPYPPREIFIRAFKVERELEAWGRSDDGAFRLIANWAVLGASGSAGPKRKEGDRQVPEGCYLVAVFNPRSKFHLSLGLDYPNASDRVRSDRERPGSDIYLHGGFASIGCLAIGDDAIEELYLLARDTVDRHRTKLPVHIFPARMRGTEWEQFKAARPKHAAFWDELGPIYDAFEATRRMPRVTVDADGAYRLAGE